MLAGDFYSFLFIFYYRGAEFSIIHYVDHNLSRVIHNREEAIQTPEQMHSTSMKNQLLVSMPQLTSPAFHQTVSLICRHDADGAIGVVINRLTEHRLKDIFAQLSLPVSSLNHTDQPVFEGGPVHPELGLVIHAGEGDENRWESSMEIGGGLWLTGSRDILGAIAHGRGPGNAIMSLGYAGWGPGQLEMEIQQNFWFNAPADHAIIFDTRIDRKWHRAAQLLGIDASQLSTEVGHA